MASIFKAWVDTAQAGQNVQSGSVFSADTEREVGFKAGDPASAIRVNSGLRQANLVVAALMQMCDEIKALPDGLCLTSTINEVKVSIKDAIDKLDASVLATAKAYTDTREGVLNASIASVEAQTTQNTTDIAAHGTRLDNLEDEVSALSGGSSTLTTRVADLETEMNAVQADVTNLKAYYEVDVSTSMWTGSAGNYSYSIAATTHKRGTRPRVHTYVDGEETYDSPKIDWTTGNVTVYSNALIALKVMIY